MTRPALRMRVQNHQIQNENELKLRTAMGKNKLKVNITSMVLPIKRRSSVGLGEKPAEKILIQDGDKQLSVNCEVDKVVCKLCKIRKYFKDISTLRYHLLMSHGVSRSSRHYENPMISPQKNDLNKVEGSPIKLPLKLSDSSPMLEKEVEEEAVKNITDVRGMEGKKAEQTEEEDRVEVEMPPDECTATVKREVIKNTDLEETDPGGMSVDLEVSSWSSPSTPDQAQSRRRCSERRFEGLKPFPCNHCDLTFSSLDNKRLHERTHLEKPHVCVYCEMRCFTPLGLARHQRIHVQPVEDGI